MTKNKFPEASRSWFCTWMNPQKFFGDIEPEEMVNKAVDMWVKNKPHRACAINFEIGDENGTPHMHMVLEDPNKSRFNTVQKLYPGINIKETGGSKKQAEDYIYKRGKFEEKNHTLVVQPVIYGEIKAKQGSRKDIPKYYDTIQKLIDDGYTPNQIFDLNIKYRKDEKVIIGQYLRKRNLDTPTKRNVVVYWHIGQSGSGKTNTFTELCSVHGEENVYKLDDFSNGGFDMYCGEPILFIDEYKGEYSYGLFLKILDIYKGQVHSRYNNSYMLWNEVHITSIFSPEEAYNKMVVDNDERRKDPYIQLQRRIDYIVEHNYENGEYVATTYSMEQYKNRVTSGFVSSISDKDIPFIEK